MSQTLNIHLHTGPWVNWSHGRVLGSTVTLSERNGGLLTAFLATFVSVAGAACWSILSYVLHQSRARQEFRDGLHHQQQASFRNAGSAGAAAWQFAQLSWYWRKQPVRPLARNLPFNLLALVNMIVFALASVFSSEVTKAAGNEALVRSPQCGLLNSTNIHDANKQSANFNEIEVNQTLTAATYTRACYGKIKDPLQCNQYAQQSLSWRSNQNASCPFTPDLCFYGEKAGYAMDTGRLNSRSALGINAPKSDTIQYRKVTTCTPLQAKQHTRIYNDTDPEDGAFGDTLVEYEFGEVVGVSNSTFLYNLQSSVSNSGYVLTSLVALAGSAAKAWVPIPALNRTDGDISIFFLAPNSVIYSAPVTDPFFTATIPVNQVVSVMSCVDQHQFCNPSNGKCTPLSGATPLTTTKDRRYDLSFNSAQNTTALLIAGMIQQLTTYASVHTRGANALRASESVHDNSIQIGLPNTQWMIEVSNWFGISLAKLQQLVVQFSTGPAYIPEGYTIVGPLSKEENDICNNQIIRSTSGVTSFSVLGVAIILIGGTILIVISLLLDIFMSFIRRKTDWHQYKCLHWALDGTLQFQRLAYEEAGQGEWSGGAESVPILLNNAKIGLPRNANVTHPRLSQKAEQDGAISAQTPEEEALMNQKTVSH
ncbi:MAG: hypothetical protein Q9195_005421 [Heterodermia aff. obscurata]